MPSNFNDTTPAAPTGGVNVKFQTDSGGNDSAYVPSGSFATPPEVQKNSFTYAADTGAANAYAVALTPSTALVAGSVVQFLATNANSGASTIAVNGGSPIAITKNGATALAGGEIAAGQLLTVVYDGTQFQLQGGAGSGSGTGWQSLNGTYLGETQVIPFDGGTPGTPDSGISRIGAASLAIGNGTGGDYSGSLKLTNAALSAPAATNSGAIPTVVASGTASIDAETGGGPLTLNTTGANLLVAVIAADNGIASGSITDSKGNTWTYATAGSGYTSGNSCIRVAYVYAPTVGAGHIFTMHNPGSQLYTAAVIYAFSGMLATSAVFDSQAFPLIARQSSPFYAGVITPSAGDVVITATAIDGTISSFAASNAPVAWTNVVYLPATADDDVGAAVIINTSNAPINPLLTVGGGGSTYAALSICFKAAATWLTTNNNSGTATFDSSFFNGSASVLDGWTVQNVVTQGGTAPNSTLTFAHSGTSGEAAIAMPQLQLSGALLFSGDNTYDFGFEPALQVGMRPRDLYVGRSIWCGIPSTSAGTTNPSIIIPVHGDAVGTLGNSTVALGNDGGSLFIATFNLSSGHTFDVTHGFNWSSPGQITIGSTGNYSWWATETAGAIDTGISRLGAASVAIGNGTASDFTGSLKLTGENNQGGYIVHRVTKAAGYTATATDYVLSFTATATLVLDSGAAVSGTTYRIKLSASATAGSLLTIAPNNSKTIDGAASMVISVLGNAVDVVYDSVTNDWQVF